MIRGANGKSVDIIKRGISRGGKLRPGCAAIRGFENARATYRISVAGSFTGAGINSIRIGRIHDQRHDGQIGHEIVQREPTGTAIQGFPNAAVHPAGPHRIGRGRMN